MEALAVTVPSTQRRPLAPFVTPIHCRTVVLRLATESDAGFILRLRTDPELSRYLSPVTGNETAQREWLRAYKEREQRGNEYYFIVESATREPWGTIRLYDFREGSFCWGSWIMLPGRPIVAAIESLVAVFDLAFGPLGFTHCHYDVRKNNRSNVRFHERFVAKVSSSDDLNHYFQLTTEEYQLRRPALLRFVES